MSRRIRDNVLVFLCILFVLAARSSLADHYIVPTGSMVPTLQPGDRVLVDKLADGLRLPLVGVPLTGGDAPRAGEVVIFDSPEDGERLIKRIVAVAGDRVELRGGHLIVNGAPLGDPNPMAEHFGGRTAGIDLTHGGGPDILGARVPEGHVLVLGDSRGNSRDSRFFGFVRTDELYARALGVFFRSGEGPGWRPL